MQKIDLDNFIDKLETFYLNHNYTWKQISKMLKVHRVTLYLWINGKQKPSKKNAYQLSLKLEELEKAK